MSSSRVTGPLLGRLAAATARAAMLGGGSNGRAIVAESSSTGASSVLLAGLQRRSHATSSWIKLFKPAQAFFGGGGSSSGSAASTSAVSAAASSSNPVAAAAAAAAPPQFGFAASAPVASSAAAAAAACAARVPKPPVSAPKMAAAGAAAAASPAKKRDVVPPKKKKKGSPRAPGAYALFLKEHFAAAPAGDARPFAQRSAAVAAAWRSLPASSRARFEAASAVAKMALPPPERRAVTTALNGYQLFVREKLPTLRDERVAGGAGAVSAMRAVGAAWSSAPAQVKSEFAARAKAMGTKR